MRLIPCFQCYVLTMVNMWNDRRTGLENRCNLHVRCLSGQIPPCFVDQSHSTAEAM